MLIAKAAVRKRMFTKNLYPSNTSLYSSREFCWSDGSGLTIDSFVKLFKSKHYHNNITYIKKQAPESPRFPNEELVCDGLRVSPKNECVEFEAHHHVKREGFFYFYAFFPMY